ncbi:hypothetical protein [Neobacillus drentensis]|nr:hypothetical protein [Neobacillus drentensis]
MAIMVLGVGGAGTLGRAPDAPLNIYLLLTISELRTVPDTVRSL